jgi:hypothetical protein
MAKLNSKERSRVETLFEWPKNVRTTGFGLLHDRVWFPTNKSDYDLMDPEKSFKLFNDRWYELYLDRRMLWFKFGIRIHTFHMGDDDAAVHDHPWWFITIPFRSYTETVENVHTVDGKLTWTRNSRKVRAFLPHFRPSHHRHFVHEPGRPFCTIILTGRLRRNWGFWTSYKNFVPHREWATYDRPRRVP